MRTPLDIVKSSFRRAAPPILVSLALGAIAAGCSLGNVAHDDCKSTAECTTAFGLGSTCSEGYCSTPDPCSTGHDCRARYGGGACVNGACLTSIPSDPSCSVMEPADLLSKPAVGEGSHVIIGGIFSLTADFDLAQTQAIRLAVREVNRSGGTVEGRPLGIVFCDNGGPMNATEGDARVALNDHAIDHLAGTLGVPLIIGPLRSSDSLTLVNRALKRKYPTVIISPSATSPALTKQPDRLDPADPHGLFWRTCPSDQLQGNVLAMDVIDPGQKVAVIYLQDAYGEGLSSVFQEEYQKRLGPNLEASITEGFPFDANTDWAALAAQVEAWGPQAVLIIAVQAVDTVSILTEIAKTSAASVPYYFTDASKDNSQMLNPALPAAVKAIIQNAKGTAPARPSGPNYDLFKTNLAKDFQLSADAYAFLAQSYDAGYVGAYGLVYASSAGTNYDGRQVAEGMTRLSAGTIVNISPTTWSTGKAEITTGDKQINIVGTSGELNFDPATGEAPGLIEVWRVAPGLAGFETEAVVPPK
jgi:branched-chain amino acid transport system substrate-binding protein